MMNACRKQDAGHRLHRRICRQGVSCAAWVASSCVASGSSRCSTHAARDWAAAGRWSRPDRPPGWGLASTSQAGSPVCSISQRLSRAGPGRAEDVTRRMQRDLRCSQPARLTVRQQLARGVGQPVRQDRPAGRAGPVVLAAGAGMVAMCMGQHSACHWLLRVKIKIAGRTVQAGGAGVHRRLVERVHVVDLERTEAFGARHVGGGSVTR